MRIKASKLREFSSLLPAEYQEFVTRALKAAFPDAFKWKKLSAPEIRTEPYQFLNNDLGVHLFDVIIPPTTGCGRATPMSGSEVDIGVYRPGWGDQEFSCGGYVYRVVELSKDGCFSVWRCEE
jgi:hypothetical protein